MKTAIAFAIACAALAAIFAFGLAQINIPTFLRLTKHAQQANATIVRTDCNNHGHASYTFSVGSVVYAGGDTMTNCSFLHPGDSVSIYYDVTDPIISRAKEPSAGLANEIITIVGICLIFPPAIIVAWIWNWRNKIRPWFAEAVRDR
jgi:hypothetical protein